MSKILFVDHTGQLGGAELSLLDIVRGFKPDGEVILFEDGPFAQRLRDEDLPVSILPSPRTLARLRRDASLFGDLIAGWGLVQMVSALVPSVRTADLVYANSLKAMFVASLAGWWTGTPVVWHLRDLLIDNHFTWLHRWISTRWANLFVSQVVANSAATRTAFVEAGGRATLVNVVYNGIRLSGFPSASQSRRAQLRRELGLFDHPTIGVFSRISAWKGQHIVLEAVATLPHVHVLLVGDALFESDRPYLDQLHRQSETLGITDRVHFLGFRDDVPLLMQIVDVVVHSSTEPEPFGRVVVEGMLARTPVVATKGGGVPEIIEDRRSGLLVPPNDAPAMATALNDLLRQPSLARKLVRTGTRVAEEKFSTERMVRDLKSLLREVRGTPHPSVSPTPV